MNIVVNTAASVASVVSHGRPKILSCCLFKTYPHKLREIDISSLHTSRCLLILVRIVNRSYNCDGIYSVMIYFLHAIIMKVIDISIVKMLTLLLIRCLVA